MGQATQRRTTPRRFGIPVHPLPLLLLGLAALGCAGRYVRIEQPGVPCHQAQGLAIEAVRRMGFSVQEVLPPAPGVPGMIRAERPSGGRTQQALVQIFCTTAGAEVEARSEGVSDLGFRNDFEKSFRISTSAPRPVRTAAPAGIDVLVLPERADAGGIGADLRGTGLLPVRVRITNSTPRRLRLAPEAITLIGTGSTRVRPLSEAAALAKVPASDRGTVESNLLGAGTIGKGETVSGYLLFPFASYTGARVTLEEEESEETEGFSIDF